jgi:Domain of unknown function (DUF4375)
MALSLAAILNAEDDAQVCSGIYTLLVTHHGKSFDPDAIAVEHRTVLLVWHTNLLIGNGGFNGFFKAESPGDPQYVHMREAYDAVDCEPANSALSRVFDVFPNRTPPADSADRLRCFVRANHAVQGALNRDFMKAQMALVTALATYIRDHAEAFAILSTSSDSRIVETPDTETSEPGSDLPRWARVAFYARCARHVLPLWEEAWPAAPLEYRAVVEQTISLAESSAAHAKPTGDLKVAAAHAARIPAAALAAFQGRDTPDHPPEHPERAALIAATAGSILDLINGDGDISPYVCAKAITEEAGLDDLIVDIHEDLEQIVRLAQENEWDDRTPVPPDVFNPDFKPSRKSWWKRT